MNPILVEALRGGTVESSHRGALAVIDAAGEVVVAIGDVDRPIFPRSAVKVLQAIPLVESGAADRLALTDEELAIACASHNGEPAHTRVVAGMLAKAGLDVDALECGTHWPYLDSAARSLATAGGEPSALNNNCSGKHAGFLCVACQRANGGDLARFARGYVAPQHPVMREVTAALQAATGYDLGTAPRGTDGCSIPTFAIPLKNLALAFARVATGQGLSPARAEAVTRLRRAVARSPFMVGGTERFDTRVMQQLGERVFCKVGAEGVFCAALPERGLGVAIKIDDGNNARAAEVTMAAVIEAFVPLDANEAAFMRDLSDVTLRNWNGISVGSLRATHALRRACDRRRA
ncbi:asparaginase [Piscinibacter koreensis]|uniref:Asparaginase n=1 Tax=Piscinibacter koreensis TaxID=2742824 RepID=A0A7Y6NMH3_9BURK|nr:asparaginase [Schlegelella koreensis]NUZ05789.1 asparaginase [Schlegelella koreensis]